MLANGTGLHCLESARMLRVYFIRESNMNTRNIKLVAVLLWLVSPSVFSQSADYNAALAEALGADDYGMKTYVMVILTTGSVEISDKTERDKVFAGHFSNMNKLAEAKKLVVAGPFSNARPKRGLFILNVNNIAAAEALVQSDPAVQAGVFNYELSVLYSSAALMLVNDNHKTLQKTSM